MPARLTIRTSQRRFLPWLLEHLEEFEPDLVAGEPGVHPDGQSQAIKVYSRSPEDQPIRKRQRRMVFHLRRQAPHMQELVITSYQYDEKGAFHEDESPAAAERVQRLIAAMPKRWLKTPPAPDEKADRKGYRCAYATLKQDPGQADEVFRQWHQVYCPTLDTATARQRFRNGIHYYAKLERGPATSF